jgi:hypothetical protein
MPQFVSPSVVNAGQRVEVYQDSESAAEAACLASFRAMNSPGSENRKFLERNPSFSNEIFENWVAEALSRQGADGKFCQAFLPNGVEGLGWSYVAMPPCQQAWHPSMRGEASAVRDLAKYPIIRAAPRLTALRMVQGGSANGDFPMFGGIFTPHVMHYVSFQIARDAGFNDVVYEAKNRPKGFLACYYSDRLDKTLEWRQKEWAESPWRAAASWNDVGMIPSWVKGNFWMRVTIMAPGLGSDSIVSSVFFPDGHGFSRYEQPRQSPSVIEMTVAGDALAFKIVGSMDPYRQLEICAWTVIDETNRIKRCTSYKEESKEPQTGAPAVYNFDWREWVKAGSRERLDRITVTVRNPYGEDSLDYVPEPADFETITTTSTSTPATTVRSNKDVLTCRRGKQTKRVRSSKCPSGWRRV